MTIENDRTALELLMDRNGLSATLHMMATIAFEKACHLEDNWQDARSARNWESVAKKLQQLANKRTIRRI